MTKRKPPSADLSHIAPALHGLAVPVESLRVDERNARTHDARNRDAVRLSLQRFGQRLPLVVTHDGRVVAGNLRLQVARELGWQQVAAVQISETDAAAYGLADNRTAELGGWDEEALRDLILEIDDQATLAALGWSQTELDELLRGMDDEQAEEGEAREVGFEARDRNLPERTCRRGELWLLGPHRLVIGAPDDELARRRMLEGVATDQQSAVLAVVDVVDPFGAGELVDGERLYSGPAALDLASRAVREFESAAWCGARLVLALCSPPAAQTVRRALAQDGIWSLHPEQLLREDDRYLVCIAATTDPKLPAGDARVHSSWELAGGEREPGVWLDLIVSHLPRRNPTGAIVCTSSAEAWPVLVAANELGHLARLFLADTALAAEILDRWEAHSGAAPIRKANTRRTHK